MQQSKIPGWRLAAMLACLLSLTTCSEDSPTESDSGGKTPVIVTPAVTDAPTASWVPISGLPSGSGGFYGIVTSTAKADDTGYASIVQSDSGDFLIVPFNPSDPIGGGEIEVTVTDGGQITAEPILLTLDSLPPAPGEFSAIVSLLQEILTEQLRIAGLTRDSLVYASASAVPLPHVPYVLAYSAIDRPDNPNCLRALADGPVPYLGNTAVDIELLDRISGRADLRAYFEQQLAALDTVTVTYTPDYRATKRVAQVRGLGACIPAPDYGITTCGALANAMNQQFKLELAAVSVEAGLDQAVVSGLLVGGSLIPGGAPVSAGIGAVLWTDGVIQDGFRHMLPSEFINESTVFDASTHDFAEDFTQPGTWTRFGLTAQSKGWTVDKVALEAVLQVLGASAAGDAIGAAPGTFAQEAESAMQGYVQDQFSGQVVNELTDQSGLIQICPNTWSNINCAGTDFSTVSSETGILDIDSVGLEYEPTEIGEDFLKIVTKNVFGGGNSAGTAVPVNTERIEIFLDPFEASADTSDSVSFTSRVEHAEDVRLEFSIANGGSFLADQYSAQVFTPAAVWDPPLVLYAKSTASTGLREGQVDSDPRMDSAFITYSGNQFVLTPEFICLQPSQTTNFTIVVIEGQAESVDWYTVPANTGTIVPSGVIGASYTAPDELAGLVELNAVVNGEDTLTSTIDVSSCVCYWTFAGGSENATGVQSQAAALGGGLLISLTKAKGDISPPIVSITVPEFTGVGIHDEIVVIYTDATPEAWLYGDTAAPEPTMTVSEYVPADYMAATVTGQLQIAIDGTDPQQYRRLSFVLDFRAQFTSGVNPTICSDDQ